MRAAVVGHAWRTPLGSSVDEVVRRLLIGERAAQRNPRFNAETYACTVAAAIDVEPSPSRHQRFLRRMGLLAMETAAEALAASGLHGSDRVGLFFGYGGLRAYWNDMMPALEKQNEQGDDSWERGFKLFHPFWMLQHLSNNAHALTAEALSARGEGATFGGANAGAQALASAIRALQIGAVDAALVVGYDTLIEPETLVELAARRAAATRDVTELAAPYDQAADGFVPGEAAVALVLQRPEDVRDVPVAYVEAANGADGEKGEPNASTIANVVRGLARGDEIVDGAGRADTTLDLQERSAIAELLGSRAPLCCIMGATGQLGAAAPLVQTIALAALLRRQTAPPIARLRDVVE
ncbi:MAG TPA: beta-ketoacyl synthase N-terminal-like domain-containing protein, partial [Burkholderiales bacterium]|nr:beta-ketoacyl synthase N-terminal-like domain-containing protein [Burkholderiales bacterium]